MLTIKCLPTGKWKENCYVVSDAENIAVVIDPGEDAKIIIDYIKSKHLDVKAILNTHAHYDHVGAVSDIKETFGAKFYLHQGDFKLLKQANFYRAIFEGQKVINIPEVDVDLATIDSINFGDITVQVIPSRGHTLGSISFLIEKNLFVGDTIIARKMGRTDLPNSDPSAIVQSVGRLLELDEGIMVHAGHGKPYTIAAIKQAMQMEKAS